MRIPKQFAQQTNGEELCTIRPCARFDLCHLLRHTDNLRDKDVCIYYLVLISITKFIFYYQNILYDIYDNMPEEQTMRNLP